MIAAIVCQVLLLGQAGPLPIDAAAAASPAPTSQPTTQEAGSEKKGGVLDLTSRRVTITEVLDPMFWRQVVAALAVEAISLVPRIIVAIVFLTIFWLIYRGIRRLVVGGMNKAHVDSSIRDMLASLIKWTIMGFGLVIAFNQIGIQITALLTGVSIIGLAIGFAAQETLSNFIAGVVIFWDKPFRVGDWIEIGGVYGKVLRITFRSTRLAGENGEVIVMPNTQMLSQRLSNLTTNPLTKVRVPIGIAYEASIDEARRVLLDTTDEDPRICVDPPPGVVVTKCAESSVDLVLTFWIKDESREKGMQAEYLEKAKKALDEAKIEIPFPHLQVLLEDTPATQALARH